MYRTILALAIASISLPLAAQSEGGLITELGVDKKLSKQFSIGLEADLRTRNNFKTMDRWRVGIEAGYKPVKYLKFEAGYSLLNTNFRENITYNTDGSYNNWRPSYWGIRHRVNASVTGTYKFKNSLRLSLRERWQYTYRPGATVTRWDFDNSWWEDKTRPGKGKNQLRSRLQLEYDKKGARFTPYVNVELYNSWNIEKIRYNIGTDISLSKQHTFNIFYRYQNMKDVDADEYEPDMHYIGVGYKFKF